MMRESRLRRPHAGPRRLRPARAPRIDLGSGSQAMPDASLKEVLAMEINSWMRGSGTAELSRGIITAVLGLALLAMSSFGCNRGMVESHLTTGDRAMRDGKLADAEREYRNASQLAPNDPRAHVALASLYASEQKSAMAQQEQMKALELDPANASAHAAMAADYVAESQLPTAEEQYRAAIALAPGMAKYHLELGSLLGSENDDSEAEAELRTAIGLEPRNAQAHFQLADLLSTESGREAEAQSEYEQAHALDPALVAPNAPAAVPTPGALTEASTGPAIQAVNKKFLLTRNSRVYAQPEPTSAVVARVRRQKFVMVTGISGDWLRIKLRSGTVGFIPASAAE